jgi:hypothetical protein
MLANIIMNLKEDCKHKINKGQENPSSGNKLDILTTSSISSLEIGRHFWGEVSTDIMIVLKWILEKQSTNKRPYSIDGLL